MTVSERFNFSRQCSKNHLRLRRVSCGMDGFQVNFLIRIWSHSLICISLYDNAMQQCDVFLSFLFSCLLLVSHQLTWIYLMRTLTLHCTAPLDSRQLFSSIERELLIKNLQWRKDSGNLYRCVYLLDHDAFFKCNIWLLSDFIYCRGVLIKCRLLDPEILTLSCPTQMHLPSYFQRSFEV